MIKVINITVMLLVLVLCCRVSLASPSEDRQAFTAFFQSRFPDIPLAEYANGIYAIDQDAREQWQEIEIFPPYEFTIDQGRSLWGEKFTDGKTYADCFDEKEAGVRQHYPKFDKLSGEVVTLELAINQCRAKHGQPSLEYGGEQMVALSAFMAYQSRGNPINIVVDTDDPGALAAYEEGKRFYYTKRGQLNFSCSDCHVSSVGQYVRADRLSAGLGSVSNQPRADTADRALCGPLGLL